MERVTETHAFFWGGELSNWYPCRFRYKGLNFYNSEQAFMWEKAVFFHDMETAKKILQTPDPKENKQLGRKVNNFNAELWSNASYPIMVAVNYAKFSQRKLLRHVLLETENLILVEASPYDNIWGIGISWQDNACLNEANWKGLNLLGKALMEVREKLRNGE